MFSSSILDTAIATIFVFLLVSLVVTALNETVAALFVSRAKWLRIGMYRLLGSQIGDQFYEHAMIKNLSNDGGMIRRILGQYAGKGPSYVPSHTFAVTLLDVVSDREPLIAMTRNALLAVVERSRSDREGIDLLQIEIAKIADGLDTSTDIGKRMQLDLRMIADNLSKPGLDPMELADRLLAITQDPATPLPDESKRAVQRLIDGLIAHRPQADLATTTRDIQGIAESISVAGEGAAAKLAMQKVVNVLQSPARPPAEAIQQVQDFAKGFSDRYVRSSIQALPDSTLKKSLSMLLDEAEGDIGKLKEMIEIWFNDSMDRVGGWYKRRTNLVVLILATLVTLALNVDTLLILQTLESQASVRDAIVGKAKSIAETPKGVVIAAASAPAPQSSAAGDTSSANAPTNLFDGAELRSLRAQIDSLSLPIGWFKGIPAGDCGNDPNAPNRIECARAANHQLLPSAEADWRDSARALLDELKYHGLGWLLTIIAVSLGAPFWFDTLNKFIGIRSVGKAPEEAPKRPKTVPLPREPGQTPH